MFPIYHFQENDLDKSVVHWITLTINNILFFAIFHGKHVYIVLFQPQLKTAEKVTGRNVENQERE